MTKLNRILTLATFAISLLFSSCDETEAPKPAPQITPAKSSLNLVRYASEDVMLEIVAPGLFIDVTAVADKGTVEITEITGVNTTTGGAKLKYTAPDEVGTFKIIITTTDKANQTGTFEITVAVTAKPPVALTANSEVKGVWEKGTTYVAGGTLTVPAGQTLTIEEDVTVIFTDGAALHVNGSLYSYGTAEKPVLFTVPEANRIKTNIFGGQWGGIQCSSASGDVALIYTHIEYAGALPKADDPFVIAGVYKTTDPTYGFLYSNSLGKFVMQHSRIAYTLDDGMRVLGGTILITNNEYILTGKAGGESLNIKSSVTGDVAYNIAYRSATNGYKWSNKSGANLTPQTDVNVYNNTAIECGWRQVKTGRGGSLNIEELGRGQIYNNLSVNCRFGVRVVGSADIANISLGYSLYYGTEQIMVDEFYPTAGIIVSGDKETANDVKGALKENDPKFSGYDVTIFTSDIGKAVTDNPDFLTKNLQTDFKLTVGSPALTKGKTGFSLKNTSVVVDGKTYTVPAPSNYIGAFPAN